MQKKKYFCGMNRSERHTSVLKWLLAAAAYGWLAWSLYRYDDYESMFAGFRQAGYVEWACLALCVMLMPLNIHLEALRWHTLVSTLLPLSVRDAERQVYGGMLGAFLTPYRAGELPARVYMTGNKKVWKEALLAGVVGGCVMTLTIIVFGIVPAVYSLVVSELNALWERAAIIIPCVLAVFAAALWCWRKRSQAQAFLSVLPRLAGWTVLRYICFSVQLALMLYFTGIHLSLTELLTAIPVYYLLVTLTPNMPVADAGIRGSWAVLVFSRYSDQVPMIALAAVLLWLVNTVIPVFVGLCLRSNSGGQKQDDVCIARQDAQNP